MTLLAKRLFYSPLKGDNLIKIIDEVEKSSEIDFNIEKFISMIANYSAKYQVWIMSNHDGNHGRKKQQYVA